MSRSGFQLPLLFFLLLAACQEEGAGKDGSPPPIPLPAGVKWDPADPHTPGGEMREEGDILILRLRLPDLPGHDLGPVRILRSEAPFEELPSEAAGDVFRFEKSKLSSSARYLILTLECAEHGVFAATQGWL